MRSLRLGVLVACCALALVVWGLSATRTVMPVAASPAPQAASADAGTQMMKTFATAADVQQLLAKAKAEHKEAQPMVSEHILALPPYMANLEYRPGTSPAAVHEKEAELIYVLDGTGTLTTGGTLVNEKRTNATNLSGTSIQGGTEHAVAKGDVTIVPEGTPHQFTPTAGTALILMTMHVPRPVNEEK